MDVRLIQLARLPGACSIHADGTEARAPLAAIQRLIRSILEARRDALARPVMRETLTKALWEREKIRRAGWAS